MCTACLGCFKPTLTDVFYFFLFLYSLIILSGWATENTKSTASFTFKSAHTNDTICYSIMSSEQVSTFIHKLCQMDRFGGRCIRISESAWEILDIEHWSEYQQASLQSTFPRIAAKVTSNRKSLSGFSVLLRLQRAPHMWTSMLICAVMMTAVITIARYFRI